MSVQFNELISRIQNSGSPYERKGKPNQLKCIFTTFALALHAEIIQAAVSQYVFTCQQLGLCIESKFPNHTSSLYVLFTTGVILMHMRYSSEREAAAAMIAPRIVDPENARTQLLPFIACESVTVRDSILNAIGTNT